MRVFAHIRFMSMLMSALALTFPKSQNTIQDSLTGKFHTNALFVVHFKLWKRSYLSRTLGNKNRKNIPSVGKKNVKRSKYNIIEYKKFNLILILHMWFHFTVKCQ